MNLGRKATKPAERAQGMVDLQGEERDRLLGSLSVEETTDEWTLHDRAQDVARLAKLSVIK